MPRYKRKNIFWPAVFFMVLFMVRSVSAEDIRVEGTVDDSAIELGSSVQFRITVYGVQQGTPPELPAIPDVESHYLGPATKVSIINGQHSSSVAYNYQLFPSKTGTFKIPAVTLNLQGRDYSTQPIDVQVVDAGSLPGAQGNQAQGINLRDKIFLVMGTPKKECYLNERIPLTVKLFVTGLTVKDIQYPKIRHEGFLMDDVKEPRQGHQVIGGIEYDVIEFQTFIYPARTGDLSLGPTTLVCNILIQRNRRPDTGFGESDSFFGNDFFTEFLGAYDTHNLTLESADLKIRVQALPEEGKPKGFSGAVGQFDFNASMGPAAVKVGDPLTLRMTITGQGNLKGVSFPALSENNDFKFYDPQIKDDGNGKILEQVAIPLNDKIKEFPALKFSYFDPDQKQYKTVTQGPFPLQVTALPKEEQMKVVGVFQDNPSGVLPEVVGRDIGFIKDRPGRLMPQGGSPAGTGTMLGLVLITLAWAALVLFHNFSQRLKKDEKFARRLHAPGHARRGLARARTYLEQDNQKAFYDTLFKTLQKYFGHKCHLPDGAVNLETVSGILKARGMDPGLLEKLKNVFDQCEIVRYASSRVDTARMRESFRLTQELIDDFERNWR